jgi:hypothetical protein
LTLNERYGDLSLVERLKRASVPPKLVITPLDTLARNSWVFIWRGMRHSNEQYVAVNTRSHGWATFGAGVFNVSRQLPQESPVIASTVKNPHVEAMGCSHHREEDHQLLPIHRNELDILSHLVAFVSGLLPRLYRFDGDTKAAGPISCLVLMPRLTEVCSPVSRHFLNALFVGLGFLLGKRKRCHSKNYPDESYIHVRTLRQLRREAKSLL